MIQILILSFSKGDNNSICLRNHITISFLNILNYNFPFRTFWLKCLVHVIFLFFSTDLNRIYGQFFLDDALFAHQIIFVFYSFALQIPWIRIYLNISGLISIFFMTYGYCLVLMFLPFTLVFMICFYFILILLE